MKKNYILCGLTALLVGCSLGDESFDAPTSLTQIGKVNLSVEPFEYIDDGLQTRTTFTYTGSYVDFAWSNGDTLGLFPVAPIKGSQVYQVLEGKVDTNSGDMNYEFDGGAWQLRGGNSYVAYHPFKSSMSVGSSYDAIPVDMLGQKQVGKNSTAHIGKYDYMYSSVADVPEVTVGGELPSVDFHFKHASSFAILKLTFPKAASLKKIVLEAESDIFVTKAKMNITKSAAGKDTAVFVPVACSDKYELDLQNVNVSANEQAQFFMSVVPTNTNGSVTVTAIADDDTYYVGVLATKVFKAGTAHGWTTTLKEADEYAGKDYVLLAGTLWGRNNVNISGVAAGEYYAWAEVASLTDPNSDKVSYDWSNYGLGSGADDIWFYCPGDDANGSRINDNDDVAHIHMAASGEDYWRIPTKAEMERLVNNCTWKAITENDEFVGYKVSDPDNVDRYIILPAAGAYMGTSLRMPGKGCYWTSDVDQDSDNWSKACCLSFSEEDYAVRSYARCYGLTIRPVYVKN
jgi:hypothetical protein